MRHHFAAMLHGVGLEIGALHNPLPCPNAKRIDYVDYVDRETKRQRTPELRDKHERYVQPQYIADAETLHGVPNRYDFLTAGHVFEHLRNPIAALLTWHLVVKSFGFIYVVIPDRRETFDRRRPATLVEHLILDYMRPSAERDFEHYVEYVTNVNGKHGHQAIAEADNLLARDERIHFHTYTLVDFLLLVQWVDQHVCALDVIEAAEQRHQFHVMLQCR